MLIDLIVTYGFIIRNFVHSKDHLSCVTVPVRNHNIEYFQYLWFRVFVSLNANANHKEKNTNAWEHHARTFDIHLLLFIIINDEIVV